MLRVPDSKIREIFLLVGAPETDVDELVQIFQTRHTQLLPLESRVKYFNFLGLEDSWERIVHTVRGEHIESIIEFLAVQPPETLIYKRGVEKVSQFIFSPNLVDQLEEMWHHHTFHTHNPKEAWERALKAAKEQERTGRLVEDLIEQLFRLEVKTPLAKEVIAQYAGREKASGGNWPALSLGEQVALAVSLKDALVVWLGDRPARRDSVLREVETEEFEVFIKELKRKVKAPEDIQVIFECIETFEREEQVALPELKAQVRRYLFEKFIEPFRVLQYA